MPDSGAVFERPPYALSTPPSPRPTTQSRLASVFAVRMAASHGLATFLVWVAFTAGSPATGVWVLAARALSSLAVPLVVGHVHDRGAIGPWLKVAAVVEAVAAASIAWFGWGEASPTVMVALSLLLGATSSLFDTLVHPLILAARPGRLRAHVLVGLSYDVAKVIGSSAVLALMVVWESPWPVMVVSLLALSGWRLTAPSVVREMADESDRATTGAADGAPRGATWRSLPLGPVVALTVVALLPGQMGVLQVVAADGSFFRYALLGTAFALGAVTGNLALQRVDVTHRGVTVAYLLCAASMLVSMIAPVLAFALYGVAMASYYQLTRALVVETADATAHGRLSAVMTSSSRVAGVIGSVVAAMLVHSPTVLHVAAAVVALVAAWLVRLGRAESPAELPTALATAR